MEMASRMSARILFLPLCLCVILLAQGGAEAARTQTNTGRPTEATLRSSETSEPESKQNNAQKTKTSASAASSKSTSSNSNLTQSDNSSSRVTVLPKRVATKTSTSALAPDGSTELKTTVTTETCQARKARHSFNWQVDECRETPSGGSGKRRRRISVDRETRENILSVYRGVFFTSQEASELETKLHKKSRRGRRSTDSNDGNICCPSYNVLEAAPSEMLNSFLETKDIVHFEKEGLYQYVNKGYCVVDSEQSCPGVCLMDTRVVYLLVWKDPLPTNSTILPMTFEPFDIPSFCSCKNTVV